VLQEVRLLNLGWDNGRNSNIVLNLQVWEKEISYRRQQGARGGPLMEMEEVELVWMQREDRGENGIAQMSQTLFSHISISSLTIPTVSMAPESS